MSIRGKLFRWAFRDELAAINARYEAAYWTKARSYLPGFIQAAREDMNSLSRQEVLRRARYFEKNSNVMKKALTILEVNVVGAGIWPMPFTAHAEWNKQALDWWTAWSESADITGEQNVAQMQTVAFRGQNVDGDLGAELLFDAYGRPAIELVEGHRISGSGLDARQLRSLGYRLDDGVVTDTRGRALQYCVHAGDGESRMIPASRFVLFFTRKRAQQVRGMSLFESAVLDLHDLDDLQKFEMLAAKDAASISKIINSAAGGATADGDLIGAPLAPADGQQAGQRDAYYREALGAETIYTLPGDTYQQFRSDRPSAATTGFWEKLETKFVQGTGLSYAALSDYKGSWGGATLRAAVAADNRLFALRTAEQARRWQRVWEFAVGWAMQAGELPFNAEFRKVRWHPPRRTTVDIGHESKALLAELQAGLETYEDAYGELGEDWRVQLEQRAKEEAFIAALAAKYNVRREFIASFAQERVTASADSVPAAPEETELTHEETA